MKAMIAGATGLVGQQLAQLLIESNTYEQILLLARKPIPDINPSVLQIVYDFDKGEPSLPKVDHVFCCLGTTIAKAGSKEAFTKVDRDYPKSLAKATKEKGATLFCIVTAGGANVKSAVFYNRVKGEVEAELSTMNFDHLGIFRPSMLLGDRKENRPLEHAGQVVMTYLDFLIPKRYKAIHVRKVALAMKNFALHPDKKIRIFESDEMNIVE
jgi:uncharacterized protein YbjT (DUF2867 family)